MIGFCSNDLCIRLDVFDDPLPQEGRYPGKFGKQGNAVAIEEEYPELAAAELHDGSRTTFTKWESMMVFEFPLLKSILILQYWFFS
jgi:hypothetical protein